MRALVDRFYDLMDLEPGYAQLRAAHGTELERARQNLERTLARAGYMFSRVEVEALPGEDDPRYMKVRLRVEPGPQVRVGRIGVQGLVRTDEKTVRAIVR